MTDLTGIGGLAEAIRRSGIECSLWTFDPPQLSPEQAASIILQMLQSTDASERCTCAESSLKRLADRLTQSVIIKPFNVTVRR